MKEYLLSVVGIVLISSILLAVIPEGKTTGVIKGTAKMACLLVIVSPVIRYFCEREKIEKKVAIDGIFFQETVIDEDVDFIQYNYEIRVRLIEQALKKELQEVYAIDTEVMLEWELAESVRVSTIHIIPQCVIEEDIKIAVSEYLEQKYCSEVLLE